MCSILKLKQGEAEEKMNAQKNRSSKLRSESFVVL